MENSGRYVCFNCHELYPGFVDKSPGCGDERIMRSLIPSKETENKNFQMDDYGFIRIIVNDIKGHWSSYDSIASVKVDNIDYIGVSQYYLGYLPHECVVKVEKVSE